MGRIKMKDKNYLEQIPVRNPDFPWKENEQGIVTVDMVHRGFFPMLAQKLWITPKVSHIKLDHFGSFVWKQVDGNRNLIEIGVMVKEEFVWLSILKCLKIISLFNLKRIVSYSKKCLC